MTKKRGRKNERKRMRNAGRRRSLLSARKRRAARATEKAACAALRLRARSPVGVPPRLLPRRVSHPQGAARASWEAASTGRASRRRRRTHFQRCTPHAGLSAGRLDARTARGRIANPPAGAVLAPMARLASGPRPSRERGCECNCIGDGCQATVTKKDTRVGRMERAACGRCGHHGVISKEFSS
jgi:hypothetical protein